MSLIQAFKSFAKQLTQRSTAGQDTAATAHDLVNDVASDPVLLGQLAEVFTTLSIPFESTKTQLLLPEGLVLAVQPVETVALSDGRVRTCTKIVAWHAVYFPQGIAEYQHALAATEEAAIADGLTQWANMDLVVLLDATRDVPRDCTVIEMNTAADEANATARYRQVILGPVAHLATLPAPKKKEAHPFCPCCLFTESIQTFHDVLQSDQFYGVRLFASRDHQQVAAADCRVNGQDFPAAVESLVHYAEQWPQRGLEFRKQFIVIRSVSRRLESATHMEMPTVSDDKRFPDQSK